MGTIHCWKRCLWVILPGIALLLPSSITAGEGGQPKKLNDDVELAIEAGLHWLASQQVKDGSAAGSFPSPKFSTAVTSLAGLAFLANGHLPGEGEYGDVTEKAMNYILSSVTSGGHTGSGGAYMYVHSICTLFALSYLGMDEDAQKDAELTEWCQKALDIIIKAQQVPKPKADKGGWRYRPHSHMSDLSVTSWQMLVLHAARQSGYHIDDSVISYGMGYVNSGFVRLKDGDCGFVYRPGQDMVPEYGVTGTSILVKSIFESKVDSDKVLDSLNYLKKFEVGWGGPQYKNYYFFATFYLMQGFFQLGGSDYKDFSAKNKKLLIRHQKGDGHWPYPLKSSAKRQGVGDIYPTTMAILILSLDKQYLPIFQRQRSLFR